MASCVHFIGVIFYAIFASGEKQPWAEVEGETPRAWKPSDDVPGDVIKPGYGYQDDVEDSRHPLNAGMGGTNGAPNQNQTISNSNQPASTFTTQTYRSSNRSSGDDDPYHQTY